MAVFLYKIYLCNLYSHAVSHTPYAPFHYRLPITDTACDYRSKSVINHSLTLANVASDDEAFTVILINCTVKNFRVMWQC